MKRFFAACISAPRVVVPALRETQEQPEVRRPRVNNLQENRPLVSRPPTAAEINIRKYNEIEADLKTWVVQGDPRERRQEAAARIIHCFENKSKDLYLSHLHISSIPDSIGYLDHLKELVVDNNNLRDLPGSLCRLTHLERLIVNNNKLGVLPDDITRLTKLRTLNLNNNRLKKLPEHINSIPGILNLQIKNNQISSIPKGFNIGTILGLKGNPFTPYNLAEEAMLKADPNYKNGALFLGLPDRGHEIYCHEDPLAQLRVLEKIELLLDFSEDVSKGKRVAPENLTIGNRNLNQRQSLIMALEFALDAHRNLIPAICDRLIGELPSDTMKFLIKGVTFDRDRIIAWSKDQGLPVEIHNAPEIIAVENSLYERGPEHAYQQDQNVHDRRVHVNFIRQFALLAKRVDTPMSSEETRKSIMQYLNSNPNESTLAREAALAGLDIVMGRNDVARGFSKSPASTLAILFTHINQADDQLKENLLEALKNRLIEIGNGHICGLGLTERIIDIPTAVDWSITNNISLDQLNNEIAKMAKSVSEEFESKFGLQVEQERLEAARKDDADKSEASRQSLPKNGNAVTHSEEIEMRINVIKRDMFKAKAKVELVLLRDLNENLVEGEVNNIFPEEMRYQV